MGQLIRFLAAGGAAMVVNIGSRWLFSFWLPYAVAITLAFLLGLGTAFLLFRAVVFTTIQNHNTRLELGIFIAVNLFGLVQTLVISIALTEYVFPAIGWDWRPFDLAHIVGVGSTAAVSFLAHKGITFKERPCA